MRVSWMERKTNSIDHREHQTGMDTGVKGAKGCMKLWARGEAGGMEDGVMLGRMNGARMRGRTRQRWLDTFNGYSGGPTISNIR